MAEVVQATGDIEASTLMEMVLVASAATRLNVPIGIQHRHAAKGVVDILLDNVT